MVSRAELREVSFVGIDCLATWAGVSCEFAVWSVWLVVSVGWLFSSSFNRLGAENSQKRWTLSDVGAYTSF